MASKCRSASRQTVGDVEIVRRRWYAKEKRPIIVRKTRTTGFKGAMVRAASRRDARLASKYDEDARVKSLIEAKATLLETSRVGAKL